MALDDNKTEKSQVKVKMKNSKIILIYMDINKIVLKTWAQINLQRWKMLKIDEVMGKKVFFLYKLN